ncbi:MAG: hypothetical protein NW208_17085 [Bryobacter sp.]|nr:hypothetical protein [Bryobacter sp.]
MNENNLTLLEIKSWMDARRSGLQNTEAWRGAQECEEEAIPFVVADFDGVDAMGQITGWVTGRFFFHVIRVSDGKEIYCRQHLNVTSLHELNPAYQEFLIHLKVH